MKIDFHVHTSEYSGCASSTLVDQVEQAANKGIDALFITDHMRLHDQKHLDEVGGWFPSVRLYQAVEVTIQDNNYEDFLVLGIHDESIESRDWTYPKLYRFVKSRGGLLVLAHPYRFSDQIDNNVWDYPPDGVEILSCNIGDYGYERRKALAARLGAAMFTNSDSHHIDTLGQYTNEFPDWCQSEELIFRAIKARDFTCRMM